MSAERVMVAGASGVIGRAALEAFAREGAEVIGLSRRPPQPPAGPHRAVDLLDAAACAEALADLPPPTHLVYCALQEKPGLIAGWYDPAVMETNRRMLAHLLDALAPRRSLRHVSLLQGTKAYGAHLHAMAIPGRESSPRDDHENFYWLQEDLLRERSAAEGFTFTIWRPPVVFGHAVGAPMNPLAAIATAAALAKQGGRALGWPGGATAPCDTVDARLLARAFVWAAGSEAAKNEVFNVTNGDVFLWEDLWAAAARTLGVPVGPPAPARLDETLREEAPAWDALVAEHGLRAPALLDWVGDSYAYVDVLWNVGGDTPPPSTLLSTIKLRQAGFGDCVDSETMLVKWLEWLQRERWLPSA